MAVSSFRACASETPVRSRPNHGEEVRAPQGAIVIVERKRNQQVRRAPPPERAGQDADHLVRRAIELHRAADDPGIAAEDAAPEAVAEQHDTIPPKRFFLVAEVAADGGRHREHAQERGCDARRADAHRLVAAGQVHRGVEIRSHAGERRRIAPPVVEVGWRHRP